MIDVASDKRMTLAQAAKVLPPTGGKKVHVSTLWRWCRRGIRGVKLPYTRFGHRILISLEALQEFSDRLAALDIEQGGAAPVAPAKPPRTRTEKQKAHDVRAADKVLARYRIKPEGGGA